jgi:hypothetical protein
VRDDPAAHVDRVGDPQRAHRYRERQQAECGLLQRERAVDAQRVVVPLPAHRHLHGAGVIAHPQLQFHQQLVGRGHGDGA